MLCILVLVALLISCSRSKLPCDSEKLGSSVAVCNMNVSYSDLVHRKYRVIARGWSHRSPFATRMCRSWILRKVTFFLFPLSSYNTVKASPYHDTALWVLLVAPITRRRNPIDALYDRMLVLLLGVGTDWRGDLTVTLWRVTFPFSIRAVNPVELIVVCRCLSLSFNTRNGNMPEMCEASNVIFGFDPRGKGPLARQWWWNQIQNLFPSTFALHDKLSV